MTLSPEDVDNPSESDTTGLDLYVLKEGAAPQLVTHGEVPNIDYSSQSTDRFDSPVFANANLTAVGFQSEISLQSPVGGSTLSSGCYMWEDTGARLAYLTDPEGPESSPGHLEHQNCNYFGIAADGAAIIEDTGGSGDDGSLYASAGGDNWPVSTTFLLSGLTPGAATFDALSPDGKTVYETTTDKLVANSDAGADLYAVNLASPTGLSVSPPQAPAVTCVSCGHSGTAGATFVGQSADGSHVFFTSSEGLWSWSAVTGKAQQVAPAADGLSDLVLSANGEQVIGLTSVALSSADANNGPDVYEFSEGEGFAPRLITGGIATANTYMPQAVSDSGGQVLYEATPSGEAVVIDEWAAGQIGQISPLGATETYSVRGTTGGELENVFFEAHEPLVAQDENAGTIDIYDARIDGGFPAPTKPPNTSQTTNPSPPATTPYASSLEVPSFSLPALPADTSHPATPSTPKPLTRAQRLSKALNACKKDHSKFKRQQCEKAAHRRYGAKKGKK